jgi:mono/diheme cytochrome c family protein
MLGFNVLKRTAILALGLATTLCASAAEDNLDPAQVEFFENKIRPVLAESCYNCHSQKSEKVKGGLFLDTKDGLLAGGDNGPAIVPGDPDKSLLIKAVRYNDPNLQMPPKDKKLSSEQIADLEAWVKMGAPDPRTGVNQTLAARENQKKNHWAFQPIKSPIPPEVSKPNWIRNGIDNFVFAKLEENGFKPSPRADKRTLIRRATFDLIGLPPTPEEVEAFVADDSERAWENVVDRLLASPQYGERWARPWLDLARYADTQGYEKDSRRTIWPYRDWVIQALNDDMPFDEFFKNIFKKV